MKRFTYTHILAYTRISQQAQSSMHLYGCDRREPFITTNRAIERVKALKTRLIQIPYAHSFMHTRTYKYSIDISIYIQVSNHSGVVSGSAFKQGRSRQNAESRTQQAFQRFSPPHTYAHT